MKKKVLVTGGTGYIGSHTIIDLLDNDFQVVSVDNYTNSSSDALQNIASITGVEIKNYEVDLIDLENLRQVFHENEDLIGIIHFAALKSVGESVRQPLNYFDNNLNGLINVLKCAEEFDVPNLIFSSSCSVYGNIQDLPVTEDTKMGEAESPYARTKQMGEYILQDYANAHLEFKAVLLRYFNPAGAHESVKNGEAPTSNATNLVPVITATAIGERDHLMIFGDDYDTRDGSCIRDYIHVMDLANAHTKALEYLIANKNDSNCEVFNVGLGAGATVLEAIHAFEKVTGERLNYKIGARRAGDVVAIYANNDRATRILNWTPKRSIEDIMQTAWEWEKVRRGKV